MGEISKDWNMYLLHPASENEVRAGIPTIFNTGKLISF